MDGTLTCSAGPVPEEKLYFLAKAGVVVAIVSPSPSANEWAQRWPWFLVGSRADNLRAARQAAQAGHQGEGVLELCLYVSDNKDYEEARQAGFTYVEADCFR